MLPIVHVVWQTGSPSFQTFSHVYDILTVQKIHLYKENVACLSKLFKSVSSYDGKQMSWHESYAKDTEKNGPKGKQEERRGVQMKNKVLRNPLKISEEPHDVT